MMERSISTSSLRRGGLTLTGEKEHYENFQSGMPPKSERGDADFSDPAMLGRRLVVCDKDLFVGKAEAEMRGLRIPLACSDRRVRYREPDEPTIFSNTAPVGYDGIGPRRYVGILFRAKF